MVSELINANPVIYEKKERRVRSVPSTADEYDVESIDQEEIFDILFVCVCNCIDIWSIYVPSDDLWINIMHFMIINHCTFWVRFERVLSSVICHEEFSIS